jgi:hypothetical protein
LGFLGTARTTAINTVEATRNQRWRNHRRFGFDLFHIGIRAPEIMIDRLPHGFQDSSESPLLINTPEPTRGIHQALQSATKYYAVKKAGRCSHWLWNTKQSKISSPSHPPSSTPGRPLSF